MARQAIHQHEQDLSIRTRLWVAAALPALLVLLALLFGFFERHSRELTESLTERALASANQLAGAVEFPLFAGDQDTLQHLAQSTLQGDTQLLRMAIFSERPVAPVMVGDRTLPIPELAQGAKVRRHPHHIAVLVPVFVRELSYSSDPFLDNTQASARQPKGTLLGHVLLDFSLKRLEERRQDLVNWTLLTTALALLLAGWLSMRLASSVTRPIATITEVVERIGEGDSKARVNSKLSGPLSPLAQGINEMAARVEVSQEQLKQQIEVATQELTQAFERLRISDKQHIIESERQRLIRDMHDGVGSQLVQALNLMRDNANPPDLNTLKSMLKYALEELRMTLDSMEPMEGDLPAILGTLRYRLEPALEGAGITLLWEVEDVPALPSLDSHGVLNLFRCLQEVVANAVQHSGAKAIKVRTWADAQAVYLSVEDNGIGLPVNKVHATGGRGLQNIQARAQAMGARVRYYSAQPGTGVAFEFALPTTPL